MIPVLRKDMLSVPVEMDPPEHRKYRKLLQGPLPRTRPGVGRPDRRDLLAAIVHTWRSATASTAA